MRAAALAPLPSPRVDKKHAAAFCATLLPGRYAAFTRVLDELRFRDPSFLPSSVLDIAAGPGAGMWAARHIWKHSVSHITAIEPSAALVNAALRIQAVMQSTDPTASMPSIRWLKSLPRHNKRSPAPPPPKYDFVIAGHVLTQLINPMDRRRAVRDAWSRCKGALLLMEPGTPAGSAAVREARALLLQDDAKLQVPCFSAALPRYLSAVFSLSNRPS
jgi:ribosomal protein RSM22 (predicted rRNA methylase)